MFSKKKIKNKTLTKVGKIWPEIRPSPFLRVLGSADHENKVLTTQSILCNKT